LLGEQLAHVDAGADDTVIACPGAQHLPRTAAEVEHSGPRFQTQRRAESGELLGCDRVVDAVSTFSDIEYSWDVHLGKSPYWCEQIRSGPNEYVEKASSQGLIYPWSRIFETIRRKSELATLNPTESFFCLDCPKKGPFRPSQNSGDTALNSWMSQLSEVSPELQIKTSDAPLGHLVEVITIVVFGKKGGLSMIASLRDMMKQS
jgi:hypothetical protein